MSYAFTSIDGHAADHRQQSGTMDPAVMQVLIVAPDAADAAMIGASMASDPAVQTRLAISTLADAASDAARDWSLCDFVMYRAVAGGAGDLAAVRDLLARPDTRMHIIAVTDGPAEDALRRELAGAGVQEVLAMPLCAGDPPAGEDGGDIAIAAKSCDTPRPEGRLHLTLPAGERILPDVLPEPEATASPAATFLRAGTVPADPAAEPTTGSDAKSGSEPTSAPQPESGKITAVLRARGGCGASTLAVNLAVDLAKSGSAASKIALVDLDIQNGSVAILLDLPDSAEVSALLSGGDLPDDAFLERAMLRHESGVEVLPAPDVFAPLSAVTPAMMSDLIDALQRRYDHIVIDMPQAMLDWIEPVLDHAATALIVTDTSVPSIKRTRRLIDVLGEEHMTLSVQVVVNREHRPMFLSAAQKEAARLLGRDLIHWIPDDAKHARKALDSGVPLTLGARRSRAAKAIRSLRQALFAPSRKPGAEDRR